VVSAYESAMARGDRDGRPAQRGVGNKGRFLSWDIVEPSGEDSHLLNCLGPVTVKFQLELNEAVRMGEHGVSLRDVDNQLIWAWAARDLVLAPGLHELFYRFPMLPLRPGPYSWQVSIYSEEQLIDSWECLPKMTVATENYQHARDEWNGALNIPSEFDVRPGGAVGQRVEV